MILVTTPRQLSMGKNLAWLTHSPSGRKQVRSSSPLPARSGERSKVRRASDCLVTAKGSSGIDQAVEDATSRRIEGESHLVGGDGVRHVEPIGAQTKGIG